MHPYSNRAEFVTRSAVDPLPAVSFNHMLAPSFGGHAYDYIVHALYAKYDAGVYTFDVALYYMHVVLN